MYWPDTGTGVDTEPARKPVASAVRKYFTEGGAGVPPTVPGGDWFNAITNEVLNVLDAAGIDPSKTDDDQLLQAIQWLSSSAESLLRQQLASATGSSLMGIGGGRTQSDKNAEWTSITDAPYNVKFDNVTDNTAALNAAFQSGKKIWIPDPGEGNFAMATGTVYYDSRTTIMGPGKYRPVIKASASMPGELDLIAPINETYSTFSYLRNCLMFDLCVDANGFNREKTVGYVGEWGRGIRIGAIYDSLFIRCNAIGGPQHGIDVACWKDNYIGIGHAGVAVGRPFNVVLSECDSTDWVYDDGLTTHACYNVLIEKHTSRITDAAKAAHTYSATQKGIEIDDGSVGMVITEPRVYGNGTHIMAFSVATHANNPAAYDIQWDSPWAHGCEILYGAWADTATDATFDTPSWKCRNVRVNNLTYIKPTLDPGTTFPSRFLAFQGFTDCYVDGVSIHISDADGSYDAPASTADFLNVARIYINDVKATGVPGIPSGSYSFARDTGWFRVGLNCRDVFIDGVSLDNVGYLNRIINDTASSAVRVAKRIKCDAIPSDGQTKTAIFSNAQDAEYKDFSLPAGMVPYRTGRTNTAYPAGNYRFNQLTQETIVGGLEIRSEALASGAQVKPAITFNRQFASASDPAGTLGKGCMAFRTTASSEGRFSITAFHEDVGEYRPTIGVRSHSGIKSLIPIVDNDTLLGESNARWSQVYAANGTINTSDEREKSEPEAITDQLMDVADDIGIVLFQWLSAINKKGTDAARWHFGPIAQQVRDAFLAHRLDGCKYGLLCYDQWDDEFVEVMQDVVGDNGEVHQIPTGEWRQVQWAGDRWGVRPDQCLWLLMAASRRKASRLESQLSELDRRLSSAGL